MIKYAANVFLAMKVTFINEIADLCERVDADVLDVSHGIGLDDRIGAKFLNPGPGFGGSCFPKDTLALTKLAAEAKRADPSGRDAGRRQRQAQGRDGGEGRQGLRRLGHGQADRGPRPHLQAEDRRHARCAEPRDRSGAAGGRRHDRRLRPRRASGWRKPLLPGRGVRRERLRLPRGRRRGGGHHRMGRIPRPRPSPGQGGAGEADRRRSAQHLSDRRR